MLKTQTLSKMDIADINKEETRMKYAYVTYLGSDDYLIGTLSLYFSLKSGGGTISTCCHDLATSW